MGEEHRHHGHHHKQHHRLRRAMGAMTVDLLEQSRDHDDELRELTAGDMAQQVQLNVSGRAGKHLTYSEMNVTWPNPFLMRVAQDQIDTYLQNPHFAFGVELLTAEPTFIDAQVRSWNADTHDWVTGALVRITAWSPEARKKHKFGAIVHLTFFGYAAPAEADEADDE
jgi:hypothetical protein